MLLPRDSVWSRMFYQARYTALLEDSSEQPSEDQLIAQVAAAFELGQTDQAQALITQYFEGPHTKAPGLFVLAQLCLATGSPEAALPILEDLAGLDTGTRELNLKVAHMLAVCKGSEMPSETISGHYLDLDISIAAHNLPAARLSNPQALMTGIDELVCKAKKKAWRHYEQKLGALKSRLESPAQPI